MLLYELALELGVRSTVLLDRAHAMGMQVDQTTALSADQVEQLREAYGRGRGSQPAAPVVETVASGGGDHKPIGTPAIVAMVAAGLVVVLLVGYVLTNSGGDETVSAAAPATDEVSSTTATTEPCDDSASGIGVGAIGQGEGTATSAVDGGEVLPPCSVAGGLSGEEIDGTNEPDDRDPLDIPRNEAEFCRAARSAMDFDLQMSEAAMSTTLAELRDVMIQGRDRWKSDVVIMIASGPPRLDVPLERYRVVYTNFLDSATPDADDFELAMRFTGALRTDVNYYLAQIGQAVNENCGHR